MVLSCLQTEAVFEGNHSGYCHCLPGYWGPACQHTCPGGATSPCHGNGLCHPETGECACFTGATRASNCSACAEGWLGTDCSVAVMDTPASSASQRVDHVASSYGSGHLETFDGSLYDYQRPGEHVLMDSAAAAGGRRVRVHGKFVISATSGAVLCQAVGVSVGSEVLEIHALSSGAVFAHNGVRTSLLGLPSTLGAGVVDLSLVGSSQLTLRSGKSLVVKIQLREVSVDVSVTASFEVCNVSQGLFGSCSENPSPTDDFVTRDGSLLSTLEAPYLSQRAIHDVFGPSWVVPDSDSLFRYLGVRSPVSGFGLGFRHSHAATDPLYVFTNPDAALEVKFKLDSFSSSSSSSSDCQAVWSYRVDDVSPDVTITVCDGVVVVYHGAQEEKTSLTVQASVWYHLAVSWTSQAQLLSLVLLEDRLSISSAIISINTGPHLFRNGGALVLGKRSILDVDVAGYGWNLQGVVDDVRLWKRALTIREIRESFSAYLVTDPFLACHWTLEEGTGTVAVDRVAGIRLTFPGDPWWHPAWIDVDFPYTFPTLDEYNIYSHLRSAGDSPYSSFCSDRVFSRQMNSSCSHLGSPALQAFYRQCVFNSEVFNTPSASMEVVLALADFCQYYSQQTSPAWPAKGFCHDFPGRSFPGWVGTSCDRQCFSGDWNEDANLCACYDQFYGDRCDLACPASSGLPCGGGACDERGSCSCSLNRDPSSQCADCADGWTGSDCSVAVVDGSAVAAGDSRVCTLYGFTHVVMFDGQAFDFDSTGEYALLETQEVGFFAQIHPCPGNAAPCMKSAWIRADSDNLTVSISESASSSGLLLWRNGVQVLDNSIHVSGLNLTLTQFSPTSVDVTVGTKVTLSVVLQEFLMTASFTLHTSECASSSGMCGNCDGDKDNDFVGATGAAVRLPDVNRTFINTDFAQRWSLAGWSSTGFVYPQSSATSARHPSHDGFGIRFNGSAAYTGNMKEVSNTSDVSFEVKIRPDQTTEGTVLVYVATSQISVAINDSALVLLVDGRPFHTAVRVAVGVVQHLSVVVRLTERTVALYLVTPGGERALQADVVAVSSTLLLGGGQLSVGGNNEATTTYFLGVVDEIRVWTRALTVYEVLQTSSVRVDSSYPALLASWSLSEGRGRVAVDAVSHLELYLPQTGATWVLSSLAWTSEEKTATYSSRHTAAPETPGTSCERLRTDTAISDACNGLGSAMQGYAFRACVSDVGVATTDEVFAFDAAAYVAYCMRVVQPTDPPTSAICRNRDDPLFHLLCGAACKFGDMDEEEGVCRCRPGYWGYDCGNTCPGGTASPCNGHGFCNATTGACECQPTWLPESECSACKEGWSGEDCSVFKPNTSKAATRPSGQEFCSVFGSTHVVSLNEATFSVREAGEFHLLVRDDQSLDVQARVTFCAEATLCITAVGVKYDSETVIIRAGYTAEDLARVWVNGEPVASPDPATISSNLSTLSLQWESTREYVLSDSGRLLGLKIRTDGRQVTLTMRANSSLCPDPDACGMCGFNRTDTGAPSFTNWTVSEASSLFAVLFRDGSYGETGVISPAAHSLLIRGDGIASEILPDVFPAARDLSFALLVKPETGSGVVMSYGRFTLFGLFYDSSLKIMINGTSHDTGLSLTVDVWNELVVVYTATLFRFDVYIHSPANVISSNYVQVSSRFEFEVGGVLTLGGWTEVEGEGSGTVPMITSFTGEVDELRVWHHAVTHTQVAAAWHNHRLFASTDVFAHWTMNEGDGTVTVDKVRRYRFSFYAYNWTRSLPVWRLSSISFSHPVIPTAHSFTDAELLANARSICTSALFNTALSSRCKATHQALAQFYYAVCLSDAAATGSPSVALTSLLSMADLCEARQKLESWPGQPLCHLFDAFPRFGGQDCSTECLFGTVGSGVDVADGAGSDATLSQPCRCHAGFWGNGCQETCPGGVINACGGRGECARDSGRCVCQVGWTGADCSQCSPGWHGSDCSVSVQTTTSGDGFCSLTANGHLMTLDGAGVTFSQPGIFQLFGDVDLSVRVDVLSQPCRKFRSCVVQTAVNVSGGNGVMVDALNTTHIAVNRVSQAVSPEVSLSAGTKLVALDRLTFELQHDSGLKVRISIREGFLDLHLTLPSAACSSSPAGLCGRCGPGASDACDNHPCLMRALGIAEYLKTHPTASSVTVQNHLTSWKTSFANSVFAIATVSTTVSSPTSIAVALTGGGFLVSAPIPGTALASDHLTVSVSLRISSATNLTSSVLWTYAHTHVFAVLIQDGRLALYFNGTVTETELVVHVDVWTQVSLVYERQRGVAVLHYLWYSGTQVRHLHQVLRVAGGALPGGGTLAVGTWQTSLVMATRPRVSIAVCYRCIALQPPIKQTADLLFIYLVFLLFS